MEERRRARPSAPWLQVLSDSTDDRGSLVEVTKAGAPGQVWCRAFTLSTSKRSVRGGHAHKLCSQALIPILGRVVVRSRGYYGELAFELNLPATALVVPPLNWLDIEIDEGASLLVLADRPYEPEDYIYDFDQVLELARGDSSRDRPL